MQQEIEWSVGSRDKIYISYNSGSSDDTLSITSDPNTGAARTKTIDVVAGNITRHIIVNQPAPLPYDSRVEYLQSSGTQYIDTGIVVVDTDVILFEVTPLSKSGDNFITGCSTATNGRGSIWIETYSNATWYARFGATSSNSVSGASINTKYTVETKKQYFAVNGTKLITLKYNSMPDRTITLFGRKGSSVSKGNHKIHSYAIKDSNGNYRINLLPVRVGTTGYMYDTVSGQLFGNDGTGDFTVGPDITN